MNIRLGVLTKLHKCEPVEKEERIQNVGYFMMTEQLNVRYGKYSSDQEHAISEFEITAKLK